MESEVLDIGMALEVAPDIKRGSLGELYDNTLKVIWITKMASKVNSHISNRLLWAITTMIDTNRTRPISTTHVAGDNNLIPDIASRTTEAKQIFRPTSTHLNNFQFIHGFSVHFTLIQQAKWTLVHPIKYLYLNVYSTLHGELL